MNDIENIFTCRQCGSPSAHTCTDCLAEVCKSCCQMLNDILGEDLTDADD